ncbi:DsbA family protein [Enterococcus hulanensis]|uniref:DsbA family protein n=1 Tax=Enterococcus hulanensis TaxID=2559929 RepID=A0ABU3EYE1_9ENTE|nr:DsbA family protein [Enterococcus hulanensis]MDT2599891.1 DsbA family protein [Enterococcus hulanensis]MDT2609965.1 DsbA family protein [Enterococcus hulanensis]MDT2617772.1 DsbA family protein [Enterococcus hulanensis]MDT2630596.1 DsbA family protein [Enterococcus hulanensis]MDT2656337.1 DsbA family protein [Enterococcus hulanensis]
MIEIYLFVNPIGQKCLSIERRIIDLIKEYDMKIQLRLVPIMNLKTVSEFMQRIGASEKDIELRTELSQEIHSAALDVKAAHLQGKKRGRDFLVELQETVGEQKQPYSKKLAIQLFTKVGGDLEMFLEDRQSAFVQEAFLTDQQIAHEMEITLHPSAVIYNYGSDCDAGIRIEGCETIHHILDTYNTKESLIAFLESQSKNTPIRQSDMDNHLSLI